LAFWSNFLGMVKDFPIYSNGTKPGTLHRYVVAVVVDRDVIGCLDVAL